MYANSQGGMNASSIATIDSTHIFACKELDWTVPIAQWRWDQPSYIARQSQNSSVEEITTTKTDCEPPGDNLTAPYDLIVTADTLYTADLITPLLRSLHHLSQLSTLPGAKYSCPVYLAIERRDPALMDRAFDECSGIWSFKVERIRVAKIKKVLERAGVSWVNEKSMWEGVEIWKMRLPTPDAVVLADEGNSVCT